MRLAIHATLIFTALAATHGLAQEQRGSIEGRIRDGSGEAIVATRVVAESETGFRASVAGDDHGRYRFQSLPPGVYTLRASSPGRPPATAAEVTLALGQVLEIHFTLPAAGTAESVAVIADTPIIDVKQSTRAVSIREDEIARLPRGRDFTSLASLATHTNAEGKTGGLSIDGASGAENRFVVDGMDTTAIMTGISGMPVITDFVEEVQVKLSGFAAEHGGATGGVINVLSRRGTDRWKGDAGLYYSGDRLNAPPRPVLRVLPTDANQAEHVRFREDRVDRWEPGFALGGPLRQNLWLFASYQPSLATTARTVTFADGRTRRFTQRASTHNATANVAGRLGKTWARVAFNMAPREEQGKLPEPSGFGNPDENLAVTVRLPTYSLSGNVDYGIRSNLMLSARGGYWYSNYREPAVHRGPLYYFQSSNLGMPGVPGDLQGAAGTTNALGNFEATKDMFSRASLQADGTWFVAAAGSHTVKAGLQLDRVANDVETGESGNIVVLFWDQALDGQRGPFGYYQLGSNSVLPSRGSITQGDVRSETLGLFIQDAWTIRRRLTLNLGVRAEREGVPSFAGGDIPPVAIRFGFGQKIAPRIGAAWDVTGSGRWKAYASWGLFYDTMKYDLPRTLFGANKSNQYWYTLDTPDWRNLVRPGCPPACPGTLIDGPVESEVPTNAPGVAGIDPDLRPFRTREAVAGIEHQLSQVVSVGLRYVRKNIAAALEDVGGFVDGTSRRTLFVGNPGFGRAAETGFGPPYPKAVRDYDGLELTVEKRMGGGWSGHAGYLWSRLYGNYSGLAHSDEIGRRAPNVGRVFDHPFMLFDERGKPVLGVLANDRTHQFKAHGTWDLPFRTAVGAHFRLMSGLPVSREFAVVRGGNFPVLYRGRNSEGRTPSLAQLDLHARHEIPAGDAKRIQLAVNVMNVLDADTVTSRNSRVLAMGNTINIAPADFFRGFDTEQLIASQEVRRNPLFLMANAFQPPREARVSVKFLF